MIIKIVQTIPEAKTSNHLGGPLLHFGTSPAVNYGEATRGESRNNIIHKLKIILKELRENSICLKIIYRTKLFGTEEKLLFALGENNKLISIFVKSVETVHKNDQKLKFKS